MPTYEYVCSKCGHDFDIVQSMSDKTLTVCPKDICPKKKWGKGKIKRVISTGGGLIFKGSGFYTTDYSSENYKADAKKEVPHSSAKVDSSKSTTAKTETKTAAPAPSTPAKKD